MFRVFKSLVFCLPLIMLSAECAEMRSDIHVKRTKNKADVPNYTQSNDQNNKQHIYEPWSLTTEQLNDVDIVGIKITKDTVISLSKDYKCSTISNGYKDVLSDYSFFSKFPNLINVELCGITLDTEDLENIQKFLPKNILGFSVDNCEVTEENAELLADILDKRSQLKSITIRLFTSPANVAVAIAHALSSHNNLKFLNIAFDRISAEGVHYLSETISKSSETLSNLSIAWGNVESSNELDYSKLSTAIGALHSLKQLDLSFFELPIDNADILFKSIGNLEQVTNLKLFFGSLFKIDKIKLFELIEVLHDSLKNLKQVEKLDISYSKLPSQELQLLVQAMAGMKGLTNLNISGNTIDKQCATVIASILMDIDGLKELLVNECNIDDEAFTALFSGSSNSAIKYLYAHGNKLSNSIASLPLNTMNDLTIVDFSLNKITPENVMSFVEKTTDATSLVAVSFKGNELQDMALSNNITSWQMQNRPQCPIYYYW